MPQSELTAVSCNEAALRSALQAGGTISFNCGPNPVTITLDRTLTIARDLTIDGGGPNQGGMVTLSGGGKTPVLHVDSGVTFTLRNITIQDGSDLDPNPSHQGGGLGIGGGAKVTIENSRFINNDGQGGGQERGGGAIMAHTGVVLTVRGTEFINNRGVNGGAINTLLSTVIVEDSTFVDNQALYPRPDGVEFHTGYGGAIHTDGASPHDDGGAGGQIVLRNSTFLRNRALYQGGAAALFTYEPDSMLIEGTSFTDNQAGSSTVGGLGGALRFNNTALTVRDSTFSGNVSYGSGGAIWGGKAYPGEFRNVTFTGNRAEAVPWGESSGGALSISQGDYSLINLTFIGNHAATTGGALVGGQEEIELYNTIFSENTSADARQCRARTSGGASIQFPSSSSACVNGIAMSDPRIQPLAANGGPTMTHGLADGSPAINAANTSACPETDQRGADRNGACDIGAFEFGSTAPSSPIPDTPVLEPIQNDGKPLFTVRWGRISRAVSYHVEFTASAGPASGAPVTVETAQTVLSFALDQSVYAVRVRACNASGCSSYSGTQQLTVEQSPQRVSLPVVTN